MNATFADYCKTLTEADMLALDVHPGCVGTMLEEVLAEANGVDGVHAAGWLREALTLRWMTARAEKAERERDDALAWHTVASAERDELRLRADRYRKAIAQIVKVLESPPLGVDIPEETVTAAQFWGGL